MADRPRNEFFESLKQGLLEGIAHMKGEIQLKTTVYPDEPPEIDAAAVTGLREQATMSQAVFARLLNVSIKTVQSWEQGVRVPSMASRRLIQVFSQRPEVVCEVAGLPAVSLSDIKIVTNGKGRRRMVVGSSKRSQKKARPA